MTHHGTGYRLRITLTGLCLLGIAAHVALPLAAQTALQPELLPAPAEVRPLQTPQRVDAFPPQRGVPGVRVKDITRLAGSRTNKLQGIGLVAGLNGTGSKNASTREFALTLFERYGFRADPRVRELVRQNGQDKTDNLSIVLVTAEVDVMSHKPGNAIDVSVSAIDDATSLQGGVLAWTPLQGLDGEVYGMASGPISIGGFSFSGDAASVQQNHPTTGRIPGGGTIEKALCAPESRPVETFRLNLLSPDFETATRIKNAIHRFWPDHARVFDAGSVDVLVPVEMRGNPNEFIAMTQQLRVTPDIEARVVINERTGTVVFGENVRLAAVAINHANLTVITGESPLVSQPAPFSDGATAIVPRTSIEVNDAAAPITVIDQPTTVGELARALNALGVTPRDLSSIFQMLHASGALQARLEFR